MSRQINQKKEAFLASGGLLRSAGFAVPFSGVLHNLHTGCVSIARSSAFGQKGTVVTREDETIAPFPELDCLTRHTIPVKPCTDFRPLFASAETSSVSVKLFKFWQGGDGSYPYGPCRLFSNTPALNAAAIIPIIRLYPENYAPLEPEPHRRLHNFRVGVAGPINLRPVFFSKFYPGNLPRPIYCIKAEINVVKPSGKCKEARTAVTFAGVVSIRIGGMALRSGKHCDVKPRRPILSQHQNPNFFQYLLSNPTSREGRINRKNRVGVRRLISSVPVITAGAEHDANQLKCGQSATGNSRFRPCRFYFDQRIGGVPSKSGNRHEYNPRRTILTTTETGSTWESQRDSSNNPNQPCVSSLLKPENFAARFRFFCYPKRSSAATCADYTCFPAGSRRQAPFLSLPAPHDGARHDFPVRCKSASLTQVYSPGRFRASHRRAQSPMRTVGRGPVFDNSPSKSGAVKPGFF